MSNIAVRIYQKVIRRGPPKTRYKSPKLETTTSVSGATVRQTTYDANLKKTFTKIDARLTRRNKDNLLTEVKKVCVGVCVSGFDWASRYGLLAETRGGPAYEVLPGLTYIEPDQDDPEENCLPRGAVGENMQTIQQHATQDLEYAKQYARTSATLSRRSATSNLRTN